ncbi:hypothetical protein ACLOJK_023720 [Asimina triloba]
MPVYTIYGTPPKHGAPVWCSIVIFPNPATQDRRRPIQLLATAASASPPTSNNTRARRPAAISHDISRSARSSTHPPLIIQPTPHPSSQQHPASSHPHLPPADPLEPASVEIQRLRLLHLTRSAKAPSSSTVQPPPPTTTQRLLRSPLSRSVHHEPINPSSPFRTSGQAPSPMAMMPHARPPPVARPFQPDLAMARARGLIPSTHHESIADTPTSVVQSDEELMTHQTLEPMRAASAPPPYAASIDRSL